MAIKVRKLLNTIRTLVNARGDPYWADENLLPAVELAKDMITERIRSLNAELFTVQADDLTIASGTKEIKLPADWRSTVLLGVYPSGQTDENIILLDEWDIGQQDFYTKRGGYCRLGRTIRLSKDGYDTDMVLRHIYEGDPPRFQLDPVLDSVEKVTNGSFTTSANWTFGAGWSYNAGNQRADHTSGTAVLEQNVTAVVGELYELVFTVSNRTTGSLRPKVGGGAGASVSSNITSTQRIRAATTGNLQFIPTTDFNGSVDNVSLKLVQEERYTDQTDDLLFPHYAIIPQAIALKIARDGDLNVYQQYEREFQQQMLRVEDNIITTNRRNAGQITPFAP